MEGEDSQERYSAVDHDDSTVSEFGPERNVISSNNVSEESGGEDVQYQLTG